MKKNRKNKKKTKRMVGAAKTAIRPKKNHSPSTEETPPTDEDHFELDLGEGDPLSKTELLLKKCAQTCRQLGISLFEDCPED